ncbi:MAG: hypothetical protein JKX81_00270 [Arenicella sp.]|nr:hypothetical protein [Arenicella sp.]
MKIHYLEIISHGVNSVCEAYEKLYKLASGYPDNLLGGARTCVIDGSTIGVVYALVSYETLS